MKFEYPLKLQQCLHRTYIRIRMYTHLCIATHVHAQHIVHSRQYYTRTWTADSTTHVAWHGMDSRQYYTRTWTADSTTHTHGQQTVLCINKHYRRKHLWAQPWLCKHILTHKPKVLWKYHLMTTTNGWHNASEAFYILQWTVSIEIQYVSVKE
jgi:hypothetical protein